MMENTTDRRPIQASRCGDWHMRVRSPALVAPREPGGILEAIFVFGGARLGEQ